MRKHVFQGKAIAAAKRAILAQRVELEEEQEAVDWWERQWDRYTIKYPDRTYATRAELETYVTPSNDSDTDSDEHDDHHAPTVNDTHRRGVTEDDWDQFIGPPQGTHGKRCTQVQRCIQAARAGLTYYQIALCYPTVASRCLKPIMTVISEYEKTLSMERTHMVCWVFIGPTQTGKTTLAIDMAFRLSKETSSMDKAQFTLTKLGRNSSGQAWFDGYGRQKVLIIDEYKGDEYGCTDLLSWLNPRRPCMLPIKGGSTWAQWEYVIITTNNDMDTWCEPTGHAFTGPNREALLARINFVYTFTAKGVYTKQVVMPLDAIHKRHETTQAIHDVDQVLEHFKK